VQRSSVAFVLTLILIPCGALAAQASREPASPRLRALASEVRRDGRAALDRFWERVRREGAPLIEPIAGDTARMLVTFVARGDDTTRTVLLFRGPEPSVDLGANALAPLAGTDVWFRSYRVGRDARFTYMLARNVEPSRLDESKPREVMERMARFGRDPLNPRRFPLDTTGVPRLFVNSVVEMPAAPPQPWVAKRADVPAGTLAEHTLASATMRNERRLTVYTPAGYDAARGPYDLLVVFDREGYLSLVPTPTILDNLIAARLIRPVVAVFVGNPPGARNAALHCNARFADFLASELVPWVRARWAGADDPARVTLAGSSAGALAATCAALAHPERFGNVISQSGAYWWRPDSTAAREWIVHEVASRARVPVRFHLDIGLMEDDDESGDGLTMLARNSHLRDALRAKGYEVDYAEVDGGHEHVSWQGALVDALRASRLGTGSRD
jgi:enterochelin esterase family protein